MAEFTAPHRPTFISPGPIFAIIVATVPGLIQGALGTPGRVGIVVTAGAGLLLVATLGLRWGERQPGTRSLHLLLLTYGLGVLAVVWLSSARAFLVAMPLVSVLVLYLPMRAALAFAAVIFGWVMAAVTASADGPGALLQAAGSSASAFAFVIVFSLIARRERYARRDLALLSAELEALAATRERNRIAREIHDSLGHYLTVANVQLEAARAAPVERDERLLRVQALLRDGLGELRRSVSMLREGPQPPFTKAIAELVAECNDTGLAAELTTRGAERAVPAAIGFTLYRAAQEALTNVRRHAKTNKAAVALDYQPATVTLRVTDDGVGPDASSDEGHGLTGLRERVALVGGTVTLERPPSGGFTVLVEVPA